MKKILTLLLACVLVFACVSCTPSNGNAPYLSMSAEQYANAKIKSEGVMTYAEYMAAEIGDDVVIEAYVQGTQSWWNNKITAYLADLDGAYFIYEMTCTEDDAAKLVPGAKIKVTGEKTEWAGEIEVASGSTFEFVGAENDKYVAPALNISSLVGKADSLVKYQNQFVKLEDATLVKIEYKNETPGDDAYVTVRFGEVEYKLTVEIYLTGANSELYTSLDGFVAGDVIDIEGFAYWYNGFDMHITKITK